MDISPSRKKALGWLLAAFTALLLSSEPVAQLCALPEKLTLSQGATARFNLNWPITASIDPAQTVLSVVDQPQFLASVKEKGEYIREQLLAMHSPAIREVRGMGLMLGIGVDPQKRSDYVRALQEKGVLVLTAGEDTIRLLPPLVITKEDIDQALACMKEVLK